MLAAGRDRSGTGLKASRESKAQGELHRLVMLWLQRHNKQRLSKASTQKVLPGLPSRESHP